MARILIVFAARKRLQSGNAVTAFRWQRILEDLGHEVEVARAFEGQPCDVLIAVHAGHSARSLDRFRDERPESPVLLLLSGTDLYRDLKKQPDLMRQLETATRLLVLQPSALDDVPVELHAKVDVMVQSAQAPRRQRVNDGVFRICVLGHLRAVKDPFRAAAAVRLLPPTSRVQVVHVGAALDDEHAVRAVAESQDNPRYEWRGELPHEQALQVLADSDLHVLTSQLEGGANALSEAIVAGVPTLSTRIAGSVGLLGGDYPGFFPVGDTQALADQIHRAETQPEYLALLTEWCGGLQSRFAYERERDDWEALLAGLVRLTPPN